LAALPVVRALTSSSSVKLTVLLSTLNWKLRALANLQDDSE